MLRYYFLGQHGSRFCTVPMARKKLCEEAGSKFITKDSSDGNPLKYARQGTTRFLCVRAK